LHVHVFLGKIFLSNNTNKVLFWNRKKAALELIIIIILIIILIITAMITPDLLEKDAAKDGIEEHQSIVSAPEEPKQRTKKSQRFFPLTRLCRKSEANFDAPDDAWLTSKAHDDDHEFDVDDVLGDFEVFKARGYLDHSDGRPLWFYWSLHLVVIVIFPVGSALIPLGGLDGSFLENWSYFFLYNFACGAGFTVCVWMQMGYLVGKDLLNPQTPYRKSMALVSACSGIFMSLTVIIQVIVMGDGAMNPQWNMVLPVALVCVWVHWSFQYFVVNVSKTIKISRPLLILHMMFNMVAYVCYIALAVLVFSVGTEWVEFVVTTFGYLLVYKILARVAEWPLSERGINGGGAVYVSFKHSLVFTMGVLFLFPAIDNYYAVAGSLIFDAIMRLLEFRQVILLVREELENSDTKNENIPDDQATFTNSVWFAICDLAHAHMVSAYSPFAFFVVLTAVVLGPNQELFYIFECLDTDEYRKVGIVMSISWILNLSLNHIEFRLMERAVEPMSGGRPLRDYFLAITRFSSVFTAVAVCIWLCFYVLCTTIKFDGLFFLGAACDN
jgi:hypothetical protein